MRRRNLTYHLAAASLFALTGATAAWPATVTLEAPANADGLIALPVSLSPADNESAASLQFDLHFDPAAYVVQDVVTGSVAAAADKDAIFSALSDDTVRVIVVGMNQTALVGGEIATVYLEPLTADSTSNTFTLSEIVVSDPIGAPVAVEYANKSVPEDEPQPDPLEDETTVLSLETPSTSSTPAEESATTLSSDSSTAESVGASAYTGVDGLGRVSSARSASAEEVALTPPHSSGDASRLKAGEDGSRARTDSLVSRGAARDRTRHSGSLDSGATPAQQLRSRTQDEEGPGSSPAPTIMLARTDAYLGAAAAVTPPARPQSVAATHSRTGRLVLWLAALLLGPVVALARAWWLAHLRRS
jgi:cohesin domain-containing protein